MDAFKESKAEGELLLQKSNEIAKGESIAEAEMVPAWVSSYAQIARRCRDDREFRNSRYPYEQGPVLSAFCGGYIEHRECPIRKGMPRHSSLRAIYEYEANYINAAGYWMGFHHSVFALRQEAIASNIVSDAESFHVWEYRALRYGLRATGLGVEFYRGSARDPVHA